MDDSNKPQPDYMPPPEPNTPLVNQPDVAPPQEPPQYGARPEQMNSMNPNPPQQQPQYGQPLATAVAPGGMMPNTIVINQQNPNAMMNPMMFKTNPIAMNCGFCNKTITTTVIKKCNCCACCLCWFTGVCIYLCVQACRGKDLCCYDATHTCPNCGNVVGTYIAC